MVKWDLKFQNDVPLNELKTEILTNSSFVTLISSELSHSPKRITQIITFNNDEYWNNVSCQFKQ